MCDSSGEGVEGGVWDNLMKQTVMLRGGNGDHHSTCLHLGDRHRLFPVTRHVLWCRGVVVTRVRFMSVCSLLFRDSVAVGGGGGGGDENGNNINITSSRVSFLCSWAWTSSRRSLRNAT